MHSRLTFCLAVAFSSLILAPVASATIVLKKSIAGAELGMSQEQVTALLGEPTSTTTSGEKEVDPGIITEMHYAHKLTVTFVQNDPGVYGVATTSSSEKTSSGVGVGSSEKTLKKKIKGIKCQKFGKNNLCLDGKQVVGKKLTEFKTYKGKVVKVSVYVQTP